MTLKRSGYSSRFQTRGFILASASVLQRFFIVVFLCARGLSGQVPGAQLVFSEEERDEILSVHNELRGSVEPPASNMQALVSE